MADILSDLKEGGDDGTPNTVVPVREEPSGLQCAPSGVCGQDPHLNKEATLHATEVQQGECESNTIHPVQARDAKPSEEAVDEPGRLAVTDGSEAAEAFKKQDDEIGLGFDKSEVAKANVSQAKDPPEGEHDQAEGKKLMTEHNESPPHEGASCETLSVVTKSSESPPALYDGTSEHSPPTTSELPAEVLKKSDIPTENCSSSVDGCQELPRSLSNPILSSTEIPTDADLHSSGSVSSDPQQEKITEALTESQGSSKCSSHIASSETAEIEGNSTLLSCSSTASDLCVAKEVQHSVVDSPSQSSPLALVPTETSSAEQESGNKMAMLVNQSLGKETEPDSQMCPQSTESKSLDKVSGEKDGAVTEGEENSAENEVPGNPENHDGEMIVEQLKSCNNAHLISETDTETLPQIVAIRSLSHEHATEEYTYRGKPTAPTSLEMEATKMKIVPILVSEPLKPVTIGSSLQPLEEVQEASVEVQEASVVEDTSFSTDIAIIDSSADEADSIGGLVINNVIGAADGVADFQPDEVETEKELTDISASAPQLEDSSDSGDERGPSAKRRKLENGPNSVEDKSNSAKKVILKVIPVKNGHGLWDSMKLQEVLLTNGTILLQIHASKESMELFEPDKNDQTIDFTAIMAEAKDDDHALALGRVEPECDDPLGFINTSQPPQTTTFRPSYGRPFAHSHIRSTALMPAMPRPTFKHLQTPQQYHMKNEVLGLPPPLEFEEPQIGPSSSDWSAGGRTWHLEHVGNIHKALATVAIQDCTPSVTKDVPSHPASSHSLSHLCVTSMASGANEPSSDEDDIRIYIQEPKYERGGVKAGTSSKASGANEYSSDEDDIRSNIQEPKYKRRGVKAGTKRGTYSKADATGEAKIRILAAAENGADWRAVAEANGIAMSTAYGWIRRARGQAKKRGGFCLAKVSQEHIDRMIQYVEENPMISLKKIAARFASETGITVSTYTVHKYLDGQLHTMKKLIPETVSVNSEANKHKRKEYVKKLMNRIGSGKTIVYIDETNANIFLRQFQGSERSVVNNPASLGKNIHILGGISQDGLVYWERRRGSFKQDECHEWLRRMLRTISEPLDNIVVVCDYMSVHDGLESVVDEEEFYGVEVLHSSPYSVPLNPLEECWSIMRAAMKHDLAANFATVVNTSPVGMTQTEYRIQYLERCIDNAISTITPMLCLGTCNHVQKYFAGVMQLQDLQLGDK